MKRFFQKLKKSRRAQDLGSQLILLYLRFVFRTMRWQVEIDEQAQALIDRKEPALFAFWHGRLLIMPAVWKRFVNHTPASMLVSGHEDGNFADRALVHYKVGFLRGSTRHGAFAGAKAVLRCVKEGQSVGITVDGPKGPRMRMNSGICKIARMSHTSLLPICYSASHGFHTKSWDAMLIPFPFSKGQVMIGEPMQVERGQEDQADIRLEERMLEQQRLCDGLMGRPYVEPQPRA